MPENKIGHFLRKSQIGMKIYHLYQKHYNSKKYKRNFDKNVNRTILELQDLLEKKGLFFYFDMGTLLGIIREGHVLAHDKDIDIGVQLKEITVDEVKEYMVSNNCTHVYSLFVDGIGEVSTSFRLNGIKFDLEYYFPEGDKDVNYLTYTVPEKTYDKNCADTVKMVCSHIDRVQKISFAGGEINITSDPEKYLTERYGEWRVPNIYHYNYWEGPSCIKIDNIGHRIEY